MRVRARARACATLLLVLLAPLAALASVERDVVDDRQAASAPVGSFGARYVPGQTLASLLDPGSRAATAVENELIVPGSVWARALEDASAGGRARAEAEANARAVAEAEANARAETETEAKAPVEAVASDSNATDVVASGVVKHGERFERWLAKRPDRARRYCGDAPPPCAESLRREKIFNENVAKVDRHNAAVGKGGMRLSVGNFADLTPEEFANRHATAYDRRAKGEQGLEVAALGAALEVAALGTASAKPVVAKPVAERHVNNVRGEVHKAPVAEGKTGAKVPARRHDKHASKEETEAFVRPVLTQRFIEFVDRYGKQKQYCPNEPFPCAEGYRRQAVFLKNLKEIEATNANSTSGMKKRVTRFADLESDEFARDHATYADVTVAPNQKVATLPKLGDLSQADLRALHAARPHSFRRMVNFDKSRGNHVEQKSSALGKWEYTSRGFNESFDWRDKIDIGPVYSQGLCSGCWAFSTAQVVGDSKAIATGTRASVSPYHLLSCDNLDSACNTGNMATAYAWINVQPKGVLLASDFPEGSSCDVVRESNVRGVKIEGYCEVPPLEGLPTVLNLMRALKQQSVAVGINIKPLQLYGGGIVRMHDCPPADSDPLLAINHAAVLVGWGYDDESKQGYWIMKNSYDSDWGEDGYAKLSMELGADGYGAYGL